MSNLFVFCFCFILQGLAFTLEERQLLGINGLLPATVKSEEDQVKHCVALLDRHEKDLDKYIYLNGLLVSILPLAQPQHPKMSEKILISISNFQIGSQ